MKIATSWHRTETRKFFPYATVDHFFDACYISVDGSPESCSVSAKYFPPDRIRTIEALGLALRIDTNSAQTELQLPGDAISVSVILRSPQQKRFDCVKTFTLADECPDELEFKPSDLRRFALTDGVEIALVLLAKCNGSEPQIVSRRSFHIRPEASSYEFPHRIAEDEDFKALGLPRKTPWFVNIAEGVEFAQPADEIVTLLIHKAFKASLDRHENSGAAEGVMRLILADTMRSLAVTFAQEVASDSDLPDGSLGQRLKKLCANAGLAVNDLVGEQGSYYQQRLVAWVHDKIGTIEGFRKRGSE